MAYFCTQSGARIVAPGIAASAGGPIPDFDGSDAHVAAELAAEAQLAGDVSPRRLEGAVAAALAVLKPEDVVVNPLNPPQNPPQKGEPAKAEKKARPGALPPPAEPEPESK